MTKSIIALIVFCALTNAALANDEYRPRHNNKHEFEEILRELHDLKIEIGRLTEMLERHTRHQERVGNTDRRDDKWSCFIDPSRGETFTATARTKIEAMGKTLEACNKDATFKLSCVENELKCGTD